MEKNWELILWGPLQLIQTLVPIMKKQPCGRIVNVSSGYGAMSSMRGRTGAYRISKTARNAVTKIIADELRGTPIKVNAVCPGWVSTDMGGPTAPVSIEEGADTIVWLATLDQNGPTGEFFRNRQPIAW